MLRRAFELEREARANGQEVAWLVTGRKGASTLRFVAQETVYGDGYEDVTRRVPDVTRMAQILGTRATTSLDDGLARTIGWFRRQPRDGTPAST